MLYEFAYQISCRGHADFLRTATVKCDTKVGPTYNVLHTPKVAGINGEGGGPSFFLFRKATIY